MAQAFDPDPNTWDCWQLPAPHYIYGDNMAQTWAMVDDVDYQWAIQWLWHINEPAPGRKGRKRYMCRNTSNGRRWGPKLYLHVEIKKRTGRAPPSELHTQVDHKNGNELDCRRANLIWATVKQNAKTRKRKRGRRVHR